LKKIILDLSAIKIPNLLDNLNKLNSSSLLQIIIIIDCNFLTYAPYAAAITPIPLYLPT